MLVAGSWESGNGEVYVVVFDGVPVPTETVHPGLLKCHAPGESVTFTVGLDYMDILRPCQNC